MKLLSTLLASVLVILVLATGFCFGRGTVRPEVYTITSTELVEIPVEVVREVEVTREIPVIRENVVEIIKEVPVYEKGEYRNFEDYAEMCQWLRALPPTFGMPDSADCDDYAEALQIAAARDGFLVSQCLVYSYIFGIKVRNDSRAHAGCLAIAGNKYYYIEPLGRRVIDICLRD